MLSCAPFARGWTENFGALSKVRGVYADEGEDVGGEAPNTEYFRQPPIPPPSSVASPRYWSDFAETTFHPRSLQPVPNVPGVGGGGLEEGWEEGRERFRRFDSVSSPNSPYVVMFVSFVSTFSFLILLMIIMVGHGIHGN